jgi:hypothetical protein
MSYGNLRIGWTGVIFIVYTMIMRADNITLTTSPDGILINAGIAGQFTFEAPHLTKAADDYDGESRWYWDTRPRAALWKRGPM